MTVTLRRGGTAVVTGSAAATRSTPVRVTAKLALRAGAYVARVTVRVPGRAGAFALNAPIRLK